MTTSTAVLDSPTAIQHHLRDCLGWEDFEVPGIRIVACDESNEVRAHFHVCDMPPDPSLEDCAFVVSVFAEGVSHCGAGSAMLVALTRRGVPTLTAADRLWFRCVHQVCARHAVRVLGVHVVTPKGQREVVLDDAL